MNTDKIVLVTGATGRQGECEADESEQPWLQGDRDKANATRGQGDREGRPYNTKLPVLHDTVYCTGDPRGRPGALALIHRNRH